MNGNEFEKMSSVEFGMSLLDQTKKDVERERKRREDKDRKYAIGQFVTSGLSSLVKEQFNAFEKNNLYKKGKLNDILNGHTEYKTTQSKIDEEYGGNSLQYWTDFYYNLGQSESNPGGIYENMGINPQAKPFLLAEAENMAEIRNKEWIELGNTYKNLPTSVEELEANWDKWVEASVPSNVFNWATRGLSNWLGGKSKEDIKAESDKKFNEIFSQFEDARQAQQAYDVVYQKENGYDLFVQIKNKYEDLNEENNFLVYDKIDPETVTIQQSDGRGGTVSFETVRYSIIDEYGVPQVRYSHLNYPNVRVNTRGNFDNGTNSSSNVTSTATSISNEGQGGQEAGDMVITAYEPPPEFSPSQQEYDILNDYIINEHVKNKALNGDANLYSEFWSQYDVDQEDNEKIRLSEATLNEVLLIAEGYKRELKKVGISTEDAYRYAADKFYAEGGSSYSRVVTLTDVITSGEGVDSTAIDFIFDDLEKGTFDIIEAQDNEVFFNDKYKAYEKIIQEADITEDQRFEYLTMLNQMFYKPLPKEQEEINLQQRQTTIQTYRDRGAAEEELIIMSNGGNPKKVLGDAWRELAQQGATMQGLYIDFKPLIEDLDLSKLSLQELDALYNFTDMYGKDGLKDVLSIPSHLELSHHAFQRNTFREAIEDELLSREGGSEEIFGYYQGEKIRRHSFVSNSNVTENFWKPLKNNVLLNSQAYQPYVGLELIEENFPTPEELLNPGLFARRRVERERRRRAAEPPESTTESTPEPTPEPTPAPTPETPEPTNYNSVSTNIGVIRGYGEEELENIDNFLERIIFQETRNENKYQITDDGTEGPGAGYFQIERTDFGGSGTNNTIVQSVTNFYKENPDAPKSEGIEYMLTQRGQNFDFIELSREDQKSAVLMYLYQKEGFSLGDLASGKLSYKDAWVRHWKGAANATSRGVAEGQWNRAEEEFKRIR